MVITHWGDACEDAMPYEGGNPTSFQDCWDDCSAQYEAGSEQWQECMDACVEALCQMGYYEHCQ